MVDKLFILFLCLISAVGIKAQKTFNVTAYGANGSDTIDDRQHILDAINAANKWRLDNPASIATIYFPASLNCYLVGSLPVANKVGNRTRNFVFPLYSNIHFLGDTISGISIIKFKNGLFSQLDSTATDSISGTGIYSNSNLFYGKKNSNQLTPVSNVAFNKLTIDFNGVNNLLPAGQADGANDPTGRLKTILGIFMEGGCHDLMIDAVTFKNNPGLNDIRVDAPGYNLTIKNSFFLNGGRCVGNPVVQNVNSADFSFIYSEWENSIFRNDSIIEQYPEISLQGGASIKSYAGGIEIHGSNSLMADNYLYGCKPAVFISSSTILSQDFSVDNKPLKNVRVINNQLIDCFNGIVFWVKNYIDSVAIELNTIKIMFLKKSALFSPVFHDPDHLIFGIGYNGGNLYCPGDYKYKTPINPVLNFVNRVSITGNTISFDTDSYYPVDVATTGILMHSLNNSTISNNVIKRMNLSGILLMGSPWGTKNVSITGNSIAEFEYSRNGNVAGYIVITDTYTPNNDCNPAHLQTFSNVAISKNIFTPNTIVNIESLNTSGYSIFRGIFCNLPSWYAYNGIPGSEGFYYDANSFKKGSFAISSNNWNANVKYPAVSKIWYTTGACPSNPCPKD